MNSIQADSRANQLINWGYRKISGRHSLIARIDRPDWYRYMAQKHAPWDPNGEGMHWVFSMGSASAENQYRRCYSLDQLTVPYEVAQRIPSSNDGSTGYCRKKDEPNSYEACKGPIESQQYDQFQHGDIEMSSKYTDPDSLHGKYKIHSMNVITGRSSSSANTFHDDLESALTKAKSIVKRDSDIQMVILKCTHVVQASGPPVEVIDLDG